MRYHITRIRRISNGMEHCEACDTTVENIEDYRKALGGKVNFIYDMVE